MKKAKKPSSEKQPVAKQEQSSAKPSELSDTDLDGVSGGIRFTEVDANQISGGTAVHVTQGLTLNKAKTADKAYTQMDGYIKQ